MLKPERPRGDKRPFSAPQPFTKKGGQEEGLHPQREWNILETLEGMGKDQPWQLLRAQV